MRKLSPDEVWMRAFEAVMSATRPAAHHDGVIGYIQTAHAYDRADETLREFKHRFYSEEDTNEHS